MAAPNSDDARRPVAMVALGLFLTMIPVTLLVVPLKELIQDRYAVSSFWTHAFQSANLLGAIVFAPWASAWSDRLGRRRECIAIALALDALFFLGMWTTSSFPLLMGIRFLEGGAHIAAVSVWMALAADWATPERRGRTMGLVGGALTFGVAIGAPLGSVFAKREGAETVLLAAAILSGVAALFTILFARAPAVLKSRGRLGALRVVRDTPALLVPFAYAFIDRLCVGFIISSFTLYAADVLGASPALRGAMMASLLLPYALLAYPLGRLSDRWGRAKPMAIGSIGYGLVFAMTGWLTTGWIVPAFIVLGVFSALMAIPTMTISGDLATEDRRAAVFGAFNVAGSLGFFIGPLIAGTIVQAWIDRGDALAGYRAAFLTAGILEVAVALITLPFLLRMVRRGETK